MHGGGDFGGSFGGHDSGGGHHVDGGHQHRNADDGSGGQVIPLFRDDASRPGRRLRRPGRGARGFIGDAVIILVAVIVVVGIATLIFH